MGKLTDIGFRNLKPRAERYEELDGDGLRVVVQPSGAKSFAGRYRFDGVQKKYTLKSKNLKGARTEWKVAQGKIAQGIDPSVENKENRAAVRASKERKRAEEQDKLEIIVEDYLRLYAKRNMRASTYKETSRLMRTEIAGPKHKKTNTSPPWTGKLITAVTKRDINDLIDAITARPAPVTASHAFAAARGLFNWAIQRGVLERSPFDGVKGPSVSQSRDRILSDHELKLIWHGCDELAWPFGPMTRLLVLTGQRRGEVSGMRWAELDLQTKAWVIPKERSKNNLEHVVPLSDHAVSILKSLPKMKVSSTKDSSFVFTTNGNRPVTGFSRSKQRLDAIIFAALLKTDEKAEPPNDWVIHDIRRTVASGMARLGINLPIIEKILNHISGSFAGIVGVYQRHSFAEEKREALEAWARHVTTLVDK